MNARQVWRMVLDNLQFRLPRSDYETWLRGTAIGAFEDGLVVITTPNSFARQWLERQAGELIRQALAGVLGYTVQLRIVVSGAAGQRPPAGHGAAPRQRPAAESAPPPAAAAADQPLAPRDRRRIGAFWVQDAVLDDYAPLLGPVGLAVLSFFYMMASADSRECWFSQRHLALHLGVHRSHDLAPALDRLRKLRLVGDTGRRTTSGAYIWTLLDPAPLLQALLLLLAEEDRERGSGRPPRTVAEKVERVRGLYPPGWRAVRKKAQFGSVEEVLAAVERALEEGGDAPLPGPQEKEVAACAVPGPR